MANEEQLAILLQGVEVWNNWRYENPEIKIDLSSASLAGAKLARVNFHRAKLMKADLMEADLCNANLRSADLYWANLSRANLSDSSLFAAGLYRADLGNAKLSDTDFSRTNLTEANLSYCDMRKCKLARANLEGANLTGSDLSDANLRGAALVRTRIEKARVSRSLIYAINIWDLQGEFDEQKDMVITPRKSPIVTVDNLKVAQFIYLILNNEEIRDVINTITSKSVLILGRFALPERKEILNALRNGLREYDLLPIVFDFDRPTDKDFTETIKTLAGLSYFVIADVTNPKSSPLELQATVPDYQIPFVPIIQEGESPFTMMVDLQKKYSWVLPTRSYDSIETLMAALKPGIIDPAVEMKNKLRLVKAQEQVTESLKDYLDKTL